MKNFERDLLSFYSGFRGKKPTLLNVGARMGKKYWLMSSLYLPLIGLAYLGAGNLGAMYVLCFVFGVLVNTACNWFCFSRVWIPLEKHLEWDRVEETLDSYQSQ
jgi:hypothetical protein